MLLHMDSRMRRNIQFRIGLISRASPIIPIRLICGGTNMAQQFRSQGQGYNPFGGLASFYNSYLAGQKQFQENESKALPLVMGRAKALYGAGEYEAAADVYNKDYAPRFNAITRSNAARPFEPKVTDHPRSYRVGNESFAKADGSVIEAKPTLTKINDDYTETDYTGLGHILGSGDPKYGKPFGNSVLGYGLPVTRADGTVGYQPLVEGMGYPYQIFNAGGDVYKHDPRSNKPPTKIASAPAKPTEAK